MLLFEGALQTSGERLRDASSISSVMNWWKYSIGERMGRARRSVTLRVEPRGLALELMHGSRELLLDPFGLVLGDLPPPLLVVLANRLLCNLH